MRLSATRAGIRRFCRIDHSGLLPGKSANGKRVRQLRQLRASQFFFGKEDFCAI